MNSEENMLPTALNIPNVQSIPTIVNVATVLNGSHHSHSHGTQVECSKEGCNNVADECALNCRLCASTVCETCFEEWEEFHIKTRNKNYECPVCVDKSNSLLMIL